MIRVSILDYGVGNLHSLAKALARAGEEVRVRITGNAREAVADTEALVLPGVGSFAAAAGRLDAHARDAVRGAVRNGLPIIGICLGMQLLFDESEEDANGASGLGIIAGRVRKLRTARVPHIGWNAVELPASDTLSCAELDLAYFAHGYVCEPDDSSCIAGWTAHEDQRFPAIVRSGRTLGVQFHPEKSSAAGVRFLGAFLADAQAGVGA
jgi:glutamine amidotransferase